MLLGPVFRAELIRTARRKRYYAARFGYGLALLFLIVVSYSELEDETRVSYGKPLISVIAAFALRTFVFFSLLQAVTILLFVPAIFGGVIADETQRKTIHYLMASRLSSSEIVLDKLLARLLHVGVVVLVGLPVMSLLSLFGGVPWDYVAAAYSGTATITFFTAALATLASTFSRRVGRAVLVAYLLVAAWLVVPLAARGFVAFVFPNAAPWFDTFNNPILATNPVDLAFDGLGRRMMRGPRTPLIDRFLMMLRLQAAAGVLFLTLAVLLLRPMFRRFEAEPRRLTWFRAGRKRPRWLSRPACGKDAVLWKERHFARTDIVTKLIVLPAIIVLTVGVVLFGELDALVLLAIRAFWENGYHGQAAAAVRLNDGLRIVTPVYLALWLLAVAGASASSIAIEREEDTWVSLVSTPLSGWQIIRGKMVGALWGLRGFGVLMGLLWVVGLVLGGVHPLGFALTLLVVAVLTAAVAALGVDTSLGERGTSRALTKTLVTLVILNGGYYVVAIPLMIVCGIPVPDDELALGFTPLIAAGALLSGYDVAKLDGILRGTTPVAWVDVRHVLVACAIVASYGAAAVFLVCRAVTRFDTVVDRPRRLHEARPATHLPGGEGGESTRPLSVKAAQ